MRLGVLLKAGRMPTNMTVKGQVTVPKRVREALGLAPGDPVDFLVNDQGQVVVCKAGARPVRGRRRDRFDAVRGRAEVKWRTDELMALLRPAD